MTKPAASRSHVPHADSPALGWAISRARWGDVPLILNLVVQAAHDGDLNPRYQQLPYQIGLAKSLFAALLLHRFRDASGPRRQARLMVARQGPEVIGFGLICEASLPAPLAVHELYLLCVAKPHRRFGVGRALIEQARQQIDADQSLMVISLQRNRTMGRLLQASGATPLGTVRLPGNDHVPLHAHAFGCPHGLDALRAALQSPAGRAAPSR